MKKYVLGVLLGCLLMAVGCKDGQKEGNIQDVQENAASQKETITIMHIDAEVPGFLEFIEQAEKELDLEIQVVSCPANADIRQAKISTILAAGETSVDIFSVNDEMVSEFKYKGYLEPLNDRVMTEELLSKYPESYMQNNHEGWRGLFSSLFYGYHGILDKPGNDRRQENPDTGRFSCIIGRRLGQRNLWIRKCMG